MSQRSSLSKARGLGSAHHGTGHWLAQRVTAVANIILFVAMAWLVICSAGQPYGEVSTKLAQPFWALVAALFVINTFYHAALGLQIVIEDYVSHKGVRFGTIMLMRFTLCALGGLALMGLIANFAA